MELNEIKQITVELMDALKASGLGEVSLETGDIKIKIKAKAPAPVASGGTGCGSSGRSTCRRSGSSRRTRLRPQKRISRAPR